MIDGTRDVTDFEEEIKRNFRQVPASISSDIESFLNELEKKRYIKQHFGE
jgi:phosphopantetheine adenylyltransferase